MKAPTLEVQGEVQAPTSEVQGEVQAPTSEVQQLFADHEASNLLNRCASTDIAANVIDKIIAIALLIREW